MTKQDFLDLRIVFYDSGTSLEHLYRLSALLLSNSVLLSLLASSSDTLFLLVKPYPSVSESNISSSILLSSLLESGKVIIGDVSSCLI